MSSHQSIDGGPELRLIRGTGPDLGPLARRQPADERTLLHVLDRQVAADPDRDWLVFDGRDRLTFAAAQQEAFRFAAALNRGGEGTTVALLLRNQVEFMPAFLGAQAHGGVAVPLNPELRGPLLGKMLDVCGARVLVTRAEFLERLAALGSLAAVELILVCGEAEGPDGPIGGVEVLRLADWLDGVEPEAPRRLPSPWDTGALVFTSGTSGGSKAADWSHSYLYLSSAGVSDSLGHRREDVLSTPLQMCHIAGLQNFANSALQVGCTAHLQSGFSAAGWWDDIARDGATFAMLMGQMTTMILDRVEAAPPHRLECLYALPQPQRREEFERRYRTTIVWQGWGMTEIFPHPPTRGPIPDVPADTIGPAPAWVDFGVVDEHDRMLGPGELGELVYRPLLPGAMASGYFDDPAATARAFRNFMFHTGDLGYYDEQRRMHFKMRNADAIRRRGENVSAVELEAVALAHPDVADAAAFGVPSELGEHDVKLDLVTRREVDPDELHAWLAEQLPRYMVPRYLEIRESLPKTVSERVEKYKLAAEGVDRERVRRYEQRRRRDADAD
jgi:crotonobetaine/carnitine-CoA ligase